MNGTGSTRTKSILLLVPVLMLLAGALLLTGLNYFSPGSYPRLWRGYYTVLVSDGRPVSEVQRRLERAGLDVMSAQNTLVSFNDFSSEEQVAVGRLRQRFVSVDPRYDTYMKELPAYFHQGRWNIYYVESSMPLPIAYVRIAIALSGLSWRIADFTWERALLCLTMWTLVAAFVLVRVRRSPAVCYALIVGSLTSLLVAASGDYVGALTGSLLLLGWSAVIDLGFPMMRYYLDFRALERERLVPIAATLLASLFAVAVLGGIEPRLIGFIVRTALTLLLLTASLVLYELSAHRYREHRLFFPVHIANGRHSAAYIVPRLAETVWIAVVLFASPAIAFLSWGVDVEIPTPVVYPGVAGNTWVGLQRMWEDGSVPGLPDLADYVAHRAYQDGLAYGVQYSFPLPNQRVLETRYSRDGVRIVPRLAVVKVYTDEWFHLTLVSGDGVARMLEHQTGAVLPTKRRLYDLGYPVAFVPIFWLVILGLLLPALFLRRGGVLDTIGRMSGTVTVLPETGRRTVNLGKPKVRKRQRVLAHEDPRDLVRESD